MLTTLLAASDANDLVFDDRVYPNAERTAEDLCRAMDGVDLDAALESQSIRACVVPLRLALWSQAQLALDEVAAYRDPGLAHDDPWSCEQGP